ncbi:hypothetical protein AB205_0163730 [Aquarana catesbeiana]|uniref:Uncharacterized protein n=1 Tax=Aquarana catesbeiana TaxID=8400 RepID=A0A2G9R6Z7_AQUCT|nr:hypothetical protein AB205_0163730 [Aquarana catesbeiana]
MFGNMDEDSKGYLDKECDPLELTGLVFLEKLPDDFAAVVEEHNRKVALIFGQCILTASKLADTEKEYQLPLSEINLSGKECMNSGLVHHLMSRSEGKSGISPFACLSGNTDHDLMTMKNINSVSRKTWGYIVHSQYTFWFYVDLIGNSMRPYGQLDVNGLLSVYIQLPQSLFRSEKKTKRTLRT